MTPNRPRWAASIRWAVRTSGRKRLTVAVVAYDVKPAPGHVGTVAHLERSLGSTDPHGQRPGKDMALGAQALAEYAHRVATAYPVHIALHTDHRPMDKLDGFVRPLIAISRERMNAGLGPLFQSHMGDGSAIDLETNLKVAAELLEDCSSARIVLEVEIGVVGGEEDGVDNAINEKLYTSPEDALRTAEVLGTGEKGRYLLAATFGNVHGVYKPGNVQLRPKNPR